MNARSPMTPDLMADKAAAQRLMSVSHETMQRLEAYVALLLQWQAKTNLIAPSTVPTLWTRHVADSLQLLDLAPDARIWVDLGSGGGFPGVILACALAERGGHVHLVERVDKKASFLREALRVTAGAGTVHPCDIGDYVDSFAGRVDCVTARALAELTILLDLSAPLIARGAKALFLKGQDVEQELTKATKSWKIEPTLHRSRTGDGWIVEIDHMARRNQAQSA